MSDRIVCDCMGTSLEDIVELISGIIINRILLLNVWDYSGLRFNFLGQISLNSSIAWFFFFINYIF